jgi:hypothetical protein
MSFTEEDNKVMDLILGYKPCYEILMNKSFMYEFNMDERSDEKLKVDVENLDTKKKFTTGFLPLGCLKNNTFYWGLDDKSRLLFKDNLLFDLNKINVSKTVLDTINKFFSSGSIKFNDKYRQIIPILYSLILDRNNSNVIRFGIDDITEDFCYFIIRVPILLDRKCNLEANMVITVLRRPIYDASRSIPIKKTSKKTSKKSSKKSSKRKSIHKISRSVNKLFFFK